LNRADRQYANCDQIALQHHVFAPNDNIIIDSDKTNKSGCNKKQCVFEPNLPELSIS
jgi:hypothetical protein